MKKVLKISMFMSVITLYMVGNNQIAIADTPASMRSQASIYFDGAYNPPGVGSEIPNGSTSLLTQVKDQSLPQTGEKKVKNWSNVGVLLLGVALVLTKKKKEKRKN